MIKKSIAYSIFFGLLLSGVVFSAPKSIAVLGLVSGDMSIAPHPFEGEVYPYHSWITYEAKPGDVIQDSLDVTNVGTTPKIMQVIAVDAEATVPDRGFALKTDKAAKEYLSLWTTFEKNEMLLQGGEETVIPFTTTIPLDAKLGEYWGGFVVQEKFDPKLFEKNNIVHYFRVGVRYYVSIQEGVPLKRVDHKKAVFDPDKTIGIGDKANENAPSESVTLTEEPKGSPSTAVSMQISQHPASPDNLSPKKSLPLWLFGSLAILSFIFLIMISLKKSPRKKTHRVLALLVTSSLLLGVFSTFIAPVMAEGGGVSVMPNPEQNKENTSRSWFVYGELEPGQVIQDSAKVFNLETTTETVAIGAVDAETTADGGFALKMDGPVLGMWIQLEKSEITLNPNETGIVPFTITIPKTATPGDYSGGIVVSKKGSLGGITGQAGLQVVARIGSRVYLTVKGERVTSLKIFDPIVKESGIPLVFTWKMENMGNVKLSPQIKVDLKNKWSGNVESLLVQSVSELLPGAIAELPITIKNPAKGWFDVIFTVNYEGKEEQRMISISTISLTMLSVVGAAALSIIILLVLLIRWIRNHIKIS